MERQGSRRYAALLPGPSAGPARRGAVQARSARAPIPISTHTTRYTMPAEANAGGKTIAIKPSQ